MLNSHRSWVYRLNRTLICGSEPTKDMVAEDAHLVCTMGHWLETRARDLDLGQETYKNIVDIHKTAHDLGREMAVTVQVGEKIAERVYDEFLASSEALVGLIETAYDEIVASINATDPLTGAENRSMMIARLKERISNSRKSGSWNWLLMVDLDHFKSVNDQFGHELGDAVLQGFASVVREHIRTKDLFFRYGGEEFLLCISDVDRDAVSSVAERLRKATAQKSYETAKGDQFSVTASFGIAALTPEKSVNDAINSADAAMYAAKHAGRNKVVFETERLTRP
ncbi:Diguanylate cyclase YdeH [Roseibium album]|nr:Diguanylate cyclase YdeH [Roseibium album]